MILLEVVLSYPWYALFARPPIRLEVPGWGRLAHALGILGAESDERWQGASSRWARGKWHGYWMQLDLRDWSERETYFLGRYHELAIQLLLNQCVRRGERVVDVGANIGMITLHAASIVGPDGLVEAFEPNPACCRRISESLRRNGIRQVTLHELGLSDLPGTLQLNILLNHTGMGTLAEVARQDASLVTSSVAVPIGVGDEMLLREGRDVAFVKVDVEGFETRVLRGMRESLRRWKPIVTTEIIPSWLSRAGSSVAELFSVMHDLGYEAFALSTRRQGMRHRLRLEALPTAGRHTAKVTDVVWLPTGGKYAERCPRPAMKT